MRDADRIEDELFDEVAGLRQRIGEMEATEAEQRRVEEELRGDYERLRGMFEDTVKVLASVVDLRDPYTAGHQRRVAQLSCAIARGMGLSEERVEGLRITGLVHDIGKVNVPSEILSRPGKLTESELSLVQNHARLGYEILREVDFSWPVAEVVLQHHERMDGSGYPQKLSGDNILLEARVLAVADVVEALSSNRPHRPALGLEEALREISENRGILYDEAVVDACLGLFAERGAGAEVE